MVLILRVTFPFLISRWRVCRFTVNDTPIMRLNKVAALSRSRLERVIQTGREMETRKDEMKTRKDEMKERDEGGVLFVSF